MYIEQFDAKAKLVAMALATKTFFKLSNIKTLFGLAAIVSLLECVKDFIVFA